MNDIKSELIKKKALLEEYKKRKKEKELQKMEQLNKSAELQSAEQLTFSSLANEFDNLNADEILFKCGLMENSLTASTSSLTHILLVFDQLIYQFIINYIYFNEI